MTIKRRFQFRLRTLFVVVTLVAVACSYIAHEWRIVRKRRDLDQAFAGSYLPGSPDKLPWLRRVMGDVTYEEMELYGISDDDLVRVREAFPEAEVIQHSRPREELAD